MHPRINVLTPGVEDLDQVLSFCRNGLEAGEPTSRAAEFSSGHTVASRAEVDGVMAQAAAAGARIIDPGQDRVWGGYSGFFHDLDGHLWEVVRNPDLASIA